MKMKVIFILFLFFFTIINSFTRASNVDPFVDLNYSFKLKSNYNYFSKILVYPLYVSQDLNVLNGGGSSFKFYIFDSDQKLIMTFDSSPYCSAVINIQSFESGKYIIKADNKSESHQFIFYKK